MSESIEHVGSIGGETASMEDVQRTLQELTRKNEDLAARLETERRQRLNLENNLEGERAGRVTAEQERDTQAARVLTEAELRWNAEREAATAALTAKERDIEAAEEAYARHADIGEWKEAAKAQKAMAVAAAEAQAERQRIKYLETNKERMVAKPPAAAPRPEPRPANPSVHRYQQFINGTLVGGEEEWLDKRPKFQSDAAYREEVFAASNLAAKRYSRGTPQYLREIERLLDEDTDESSTNDRRNESSRQDGQDRQQLRQEGGERQNDASRRPSSDLPPSRRAGPGQNPSGSRGEFRLSADEVEIADGLYGEPSNLEWYIADPAERYRRYYEMKLKKQSR